VGAERRPAAALALAIAVVLAATISLAMAGPEGRAAASTRQHAQQSWHTCAPPAHLASGQIVVPVVVDFGEPQAKVLVTCVTTRPGDTGAEILQAQAPLVGYPMPRYDESGSGLLCGIDGYPSTGCGTESGGHYSYWAYWHGGKRWQYASDGPGEWTVSKGDVEGWRFEPDGSASPSDPPPRAPSRATELEAPASVHQAASTATTNAKTANKSSAGGAPGPIGQIDGGRSRSKTGLFITCLALIILLGAAATARSRRTSRHGT
jgi:hypothetical protein